MTAPNLRQTQYTTPINMHPPAKLLLYSLQGARHPLRDRLVPQLEAPLPVLRAIVRKAQKVKRLRFAQPSPLTVLSCEPPELDEPGLVRVQFQFKTSKPLLQVTQKSLRVLLVLETHHEIIGVPHDDCVAFYLVVAPLLLESEIENVMQVDVGQNRRNDALNAKGNLRLRGCRCRVSTGLDHRRVIPGWGLNGEW